MKKISFAFILVSMVNAYSQMDPQLKKDIKGIETKVIEWRHDFHQNPELSNREFKTARKMQNTYLVLV